MDGPHCFVIDSYPRLMGGGLGVVWLGSRKIQILPRYSNAVTHADTQHAVGNALRQHRRPLVDGLVGNAHQLSSADRATTEKSNGFIFEHSGIEP